MRGLYKTLFAVMTNEPTPLRLDSLLSEELSYHQSNNAKDFKDTIDPELVLYPQS